MGPCLTLGGACRGSSNCRFGKHRGRRNDAVVHSWLQRLQKVVNFSLSVFGGVSNHADATLVQGEKILHVDITQGYLVSITNNYAYDSCTAYLLANVETAPTS